MEQNEGDGQTGILRTTGSGENRFVAEGTGSPPTSVEHRFVKSRIETECGGSRLERVRSKGSTA